MRQYKIADIERDLNKVDDLITKFQQLNADTVFINKLKNKQNFFCHRTTKSKFRLFVLLWQFITRKYHLYTNGRINAFIRDVFAKY
jgi:hypothetical protein